jgi:hypothetical protein
MNVPRSIMGPLLLGAVVALAGCSDTRGPEVATAQSAATAAPGGGPATTPVKVSDYDKALLYTRCMNQHGEQMDDPVEGKPLPITGTNHGGGDSFSAGPNAFLECKHLMPATWPVQVDPKDLARERPFVECLRKHGIDTPEPDANGMVRYPADPTTVFRPEYEAAEAACRHLVDDPAIRAGDQ